MGGVLITLMAAFAPANRFQLLEGTAAMSDAILSAKSSPSTGFLSNEKVPLIAPPIANAAVSCAKPVSRIAGNFG
jgi:hypothetical protein